MPITKATASSVAPAAKGDLVVGSATNDASVLAVGTNNYVLTADSAQATGLKWAAAAAGGKILQVRYNSTTTEKTNTSSSTFVDTNLSHTITPSSTANQVLVLIVQLMMMGHNNGHECGIVWKLVRNSTDILTLSPLANYMAATAAPPNTDLVLMHFQSLNYLDSPSSTSELTYKTQFKVSSGTDVVAQQHSCTSTIILMEVAA